MVNAHSDGDEGAEDEASRCRHRGPNRVRAIVIPVTGRRANGNHGLEELHVPLGLTHDVDCPARVIGVLQVQINESKKGVSVIFIREMKNQIVILFSSVVFVMGFLPASSRL